MGITQSYALLQFILNIVLEISEELFKTNKIHKTCKAKSHVILVWDEIIICIETMNNYLKQK